MPARVNLHEDQFFVCVKSAFQNMAAVRRTWLYECMCAYAEISIIGLISHRCQVAIGNFEDQLETGPDCPDCLAT
jgi:hypothetical protein